MDWNLVKSFRLFCHLKIFFVLVLLTNVQSQYTRMQEQVILERILAKTDEGRYDHRVRPVNSSNTSEPVLVSVNFFLRHIDKVDDDNQEFSIRITYRQKWRDSRLSYSLTDNYQRSTTQQVTLVNPQNQIWSPDTFFANAKAGNYHDMMSRNEFVRIYPNGDVLQSSRISLRLSCPMNLRKFPMDEQICSMRLASYGYTTSDVKYEWEKQDPVQISQTLAVPEFVLKGMVTSYCDSITSTGSYSCLRVDFTFRRAFKSYLIHVYIPCVMMTIVSWLSFWISIQAVTARTVLTTLTLLVLAIQTSEVNKSFPHADYTRSVDHYTGTCLTFVMASLVEFIIVQYMTRRNERKSSNNSKSASQILETGAAGDESSPEQEQDIPLKDINSGDDVERESQGAAGSPRNAPNIKQRMQNVARKYLGAFDSLPEKIDGACRIIYPVLFVIYNIIYWPVSYA